MNLIIAFTLLSSTLFANLDSRMQKARDLYDSRKIREAYVEYKSIQDSLKGDNSAVLFNLGNISFKLGRLGVARAYYTKALRIKPRDKDIRYNLELVNSSLGLKSKSSLLRKFLNYFSLDEMAIANFMIFVICIILLTVFNIRRKKAKAGSLIIFLTGSFFIMFFLLIVATGFKYYLERETGIVIDKTTLNAAPMESSTSLVDIPEGVLVKFEMREGEWVKVNYDDEFIGWVKKEKFMEL